MHDDRIKEVLYDVIYGIGEDRIEALVSQGMSRDVINRIYDGAAERLQGCDGIRTTAILATGLLHYMLTACLIPSQRKVDCGGHTLDIVIPDTKTLLASPRRALVILIPCDQRMPDVSGLQPHAGNAWLVSERKHAGIRTFVPGRDFAGIIDAVRDFLKGSGQSKLKIFRV